MKDLEKNWLSFEKLCYSLENRGFSSLNDELKAELIVEEGKYVPNNWMILEAEQLNPYNVTNEIAKRFAVAQLLGEIAVKRSKRDLINERKSTKLEINKLLKNIEKFLWEFIEKISEDDGKSAEIQKLINLDLVSNKKKAFQLVRLKMEEIIKVSRDLYVENEKLSRERKNLLKILKTDDSNAKLDELLEKALQNSSREVDKVRNTVLLERNNWSNFNYKVKQIKEDLEKSLSIKQDEIEHLKCHLIDKDKRIRHLAEENERKRRRLEFYTKELHITRAKNQVLENSRRLQYNWKVY